MRILPTALTIFGFIPFAPVAFAQAPPTFSEARPAQTSAANPPGTQLAIVPSPAGESATPSVGRSHIRPGALFTSVQAGFGHLATHVADGKAAFTLSGAAFGGSLSVGATVVPNLVLFGQLGLYKASNPSIEMDGRSTDTHDVKLTQVWIGPGAAYYFMPINVFVSATLGLSRSTIEAPRVTGRTELGPTLTVQVGKEWWMNDRAAIGVAAQALFASMKDAESDARETSRALSLGVTLSYN